MPKPRKIHGTVNVSQGDRSRCQSMSHKINATAKSDALIASVSIVRPLLMSSTVVNQEIAAIMDAPPQKLPLTSPTMGSAPTRTEMAEEKRAVHSLRAPKKRSADGPSQLISG